MRATRIALAAIVLGLGAISSGCGGGASRPGSVTAPPATAAPASAATARPVAATATSPPTSPGSGGVVPSSTGTTTSAARTRATATSTTTTTTTTTTATTPTTTRKSAAPGPPRPPIVWDPIPFGPVRKAQMEAYVQRHYGSFMKPTWRLIDPHVIVIHYTDASYSSTFNTFATDVPDSELHELPATCAHFVIDTEGTIHQLVSLGAMCRHTVGLNWTAIGIEHVGYSDAQVLDNPRQISSSLKLVHWLTCRYHILIRNVIGHNESLSSPYHHEDVASLRTQTHADFNHQDMNTYRARLRALGGC